MFDFYLLIFVGLLPNVIESRAPVWDHFVYAQQWPMTSCIDANLTHSHDCHISDNITTWTVHGLWPTDGTSENPSFCNESTSFDPDKISSILSQLCQFWPNLYRDSDFYNFWTHEWCKHGTCAVTLLDLNSEEKYFQKGMDLRSTYDLFGILKSAGIVPKDDTTYQYSEFLSTLHGGLNTTPKMMCVYDKHTKAQYIAEIEFCIGKDFKTMECPSKRSRKHSELNLERNIDAYMEQKMERSSSFAAAAAAGQTSCKQRLGRRSPMASEPCRDTEPLVYPVIGHF